MKQLSLSTLRPGNGRQLAMLMAGAGLVAALGIYPLVGHADDHDARKDHDQARQALLAGKVLSLRQVLDRVEKDYPGEPVEIEFEDEDDAYLYKIKLLQPAGTILKLRVDARTGEVIGVKGRGIEQGHD